MTLMASISSSRRWRRDPLSMPLVPTGTGPVPATMFLATWGPGGAGVANFTWARPTLKADGSSLPNGDISHFLLREYDVTTGNLVGSPINVGNVTSYSRTGLGAGGHDFTLACVSGYGEGEESHKYRVTVT